MPPEVHVVTGAFGYTGRYIARGLIAQGRRVQTLTGHPGRTADLGAPVPAAPYNFDNPEALRRSLEGVSVLYNTYWVRFDYGETTFERAVANTRTLLRAARDAGVRRVVQISITGADARSRLPYFRGKGLVEEAVRASGLSYALVRPSLVFGAEDILMNNIAWFLRRFPFFPLPGSGGYPVQPVAVEDVATLAVQAGGASENQEIDAVGPDTFTFRELVTILRGAVGSRASLVPAPPPLALLLSRIGGLGLGDVVLTRHEVEGLMAGLLVSHGPPTCPTRFPDWAAAAGRTLGIRYASEIARHYR